MLTRNKAYIQDETIAWINAQISGNVPPATSSFTYNQQNVEEILV